MNESANNDRQTVTDILTKAFFDNRSVNYIISERGIKEQKIRALMEYSYDVCNLYGKVYISKDRNACALVHYPDQKKNNFKSFWLDLKLIIRSTGLVNILKVLAREKTIKMNYPVTPMSYLWFIGVLPEFQNQGYGKMLLEEIITDSKHMNKPLYLETSSEKNVSWYLNSGFELYEELDFGYRLYMFRSGFK